MTKKFTRKIGNKLSVEQKLELFNKAMEGDVNAICKCSLMRGMMTQKDYDECMEIEDEEEI
jgi:hypothetical protein